MFVCDYKLGYMEICRDVQGYIGNSGCIQAKALGHSFRRDLNKFWDPVVRFSATRALCRTFAHFREYLKAFCHASGLLLHCGAALGCLPCRSFSNACIPLAAGQQHILRPVADALLLLAACVGHGYIIPHHPLRTPSTSHV